MDKHDILGIILIIFSIIFFGFFIWWGTTTYNPNFGIGIIIVAIGTFLSGIFIIIGRINSQLKH